MIQSVFVFKFCDFCDFGVSGVTKKVASLGFEHLFVHLVMWPWHPCLSVKRNFSHFPLQPLSISSLYGIQQIQNEDGKAKQMS